MRILVTDGMDKGAIEKVRAMGHELVEQFYEPDELGKALRDFDVAIIRSKTKLRAKQIDEAKGSRFKCVIRAGVGLDNIDVQYAKDNGIEVKNTPKSPSESVAELAMAHMFSCARYISIAGHSMREGKWEKKAYGKGIELTGKTLGIVGFGRIAGETVGFIANQPLVMAGVLDCDSSDKAARFIRFCDCFNIPIVTLEDLPGYLPGVDQEHAGVIRHGAKMLYAYSEATVPSITVVLRKAYGGGYIAMGSRHLRADFVFAWPLAEIAVMGPEGAANIIFKKDIVGAENPAEMRKLKIQEYKEKFANPYVAAAKGYIDSVIAPAETRMFIEHALKVSAHKNRSQPSKKHGNPPF